MLEHLNRIFIILLLLAALSAILLSVGTLTLDFFGGESASTAWEPLDHTSDLHIASDAPSYASPDDSPYQMNLTLSLPPLERQDLLSVEIYTSDNRHLASKDCLKDLIKGGEGDGDSDSERSVSPDNNRSGAQILETGRNNTVIGLTEVVCSVDLPYTYSNSEGYLLFAKLERGSKEFSSDNILETHIDWRGYESAFWGFSIFFGMLLLAGYLLLVLPLTALVLYVAKKQKHEGIDADAYSLKTLLMPFSAGKALLQNINSFLVSPYFWSIEFIGILFILIYMAFSAEIWKGGIALVAFFFSGAAAFIIPYVWCMAWWYADYREREPLRMMVTFFFWGMLAALMAIGINSIAGTLFAIIGLGFLGSFLVAPIVEESFKGTGLALFSEHPEFNSVEDGFLFGFVIGMGFAFIENWIYFLQTPMGSDISSWIGLFFLRSVLFSANHGLYTAITGGIIGFLIEKKFRAPALGLLVAVPIAAFFHAMHNSGEMLGLLGLGGLILYCCFLIPLFDYGGVIVLILLFLRAVFRNKPERG